MKSLLAFSFALSFHISGNHIQIQGAHITSYGRGLAVKDDSQERVIGHRCQTMYHGTQCFDVTAGAIFYHLVSKDPEISAAIGNARWTTAYDVEGKMREINVGDEDNTYYEVEVEEFSAHVHR